MGGTRLYYEVVGSGPPAVFVHSGFADRRIWERQWGAFEEHRMVRYDLRGAGKSAGSSTPYFDHEDLQNLLQRLDVQRAHVVGLATGGLIALDLTVSRPELVESLAHANVRLSFGSALDRVLVSPRFHRLHHAIGLGHESRGQGSLGGHNYAVLFPLWDLLFGTFHLPAGRKPQRFGVDEPVPASLAGQLAYPFRRSPA